MNREVCGACGMQPHNCQCDNYQQLVEQYAIQIFVAIYQSNAPIEELRAEAIEQAKLLAKEVRGDTK